MTENKICSVTNRSAGRVIYKLPEDGIRREFQPGEVKKISYDELAKLSMQPGGRTLMENYLLIESTEVTEDLNINTEPEYYLTNDEIIALIKTGSQDEWLDMLDFAPAGVLDIVKDLCVKLPLNDVAKREALYKRTGFSVDTAIMNLNAEAKDTGVVETGKRTTRRVQKNAAPKAEENKPARRTSVAEDKYKVISERDE